MATPRSTSRGRLFADRAARWIVTAGGLTIIASVLGILFFIVHEVLPLTSRTRVAPEPPLAIPGIEPAAVLTDEYRELIAILGADGRVRAIRRTTGETVAEAALAVGEPGSWTAAVPPGGSSFVVGTADGRVAVQRVRFPSSHASGSRVVGADLPPADVVDVDPQRRPISRAAAQISESGDALTIAAALADGSLAVERTAATTNEMTGEVARETSRKTAPLPGPVAALVLDVAQANVYAGLADGRVVWWGLAPDGSTLPPLISGEGAPVSAMTLLLGDRALVVGREDGSVEVFFPLARGTERSLKKVRSFPARSAPVAAIAPSPRGKGFLVLDRTGGMALMYSTSERVLWEGVSPAASPTAIAYAPKADGAVVACAGRAVSLSIEAPHPEVGWTALFGKVWYEGYERPEYAWQSSSGTEDFEPKLSLVPLIFGTLKGTLYSLALAVPLGVLSAMYASQFLHPSLRRIVKPIVETMASLPSVVLGFLAGLWLAPLLERVLPALVLMALVLPPTIVLAGFVWGRLTRRLRAAPPAGAEVFFFVGVLAVAVASCLRLESLLESSVLGGTFPTWLLETFGIRYDQRNAIVVGLAMGFAVIPIIFAIAEDAFSNVPRTLVSGSLALGASQWQTVTRVVLPAASPGIFAAIMVGFGRAVGETMIVLMATGNTPIMDWSPFNGFRTLSANIAVEIPEAPVGGTLYRTIFLAALLLFALTFAVNTVAELVRQRLRRKYSSL